MKTIGAAISLLRQKIPCAGKENPCPCKKKFPAPQQQEFAASHWKCNINSFRNRPLCAESEKKFAAKFPAGGKSRILPDAAGADRLR